MQADVDGTTPAPMTTTATGTSPAGNPVTDQARFESSQDEPPLLTVANTPRATDTVKHDTLTVEKTAPTLSPASPRAALNALSAPRGFCIANESVSAFTSDNVTANESVPPFASEHVTANESVPAFASEHVTALTNESLPPFARERVTTAEGVANFAPHTDQRDHIVDDPVKDHTGTVHSGRPRSRRQS